MADRPAVSAPNTDVGCQARAAINAPPTQAPNTEPARELVEAILDDARELWGNGDIRFAHDSDELLARLTKNVEALGALAAREETT